MRPTFIKHVCDVHSSLHSHLEVMLCCAELKQVASSAPKYVKHQNYLSIQANIQWFHWVFIMISDVLCLKRIVYHLISIPIANPEMLPSVPRIKNAFKYKFQFILNSSHKTRICILTCDGCLWSSWVWLVWEAQHLSLVWCWIDDGWMISSGWSAMGVDVVVLGGLHAAQPQALREYPRQSRVELQCPSYSVQLEQCNTIKAKDNLQIKYRLWHFARSVQLDWYLIIRTICSI